MRTKKILHSDEGYSIDSKQGLLFKWAVQHAAFLSHVHYHKKCSDIVVKACVYICARSEM